MTECKVRRLLLSGDVTMSISVKCVAVLLLRYRLVPFGNYSYLESLTDKSKELPLYSSGGIKFFWDTK